MSNSLVLVIDSREFLMDFGVETFRPGGGMELRTWGA